MDLIMEQMPIVIQALNVGFIQTLKLFFVTLIGALPLGLLIAFGSMSRFKPLSWLMKTIVWIIRGTPLMIQLLIIFYFPGLALDNNVWGSGRPAVLLRLRSVLSSIMPVIFQKYTGAASRACLWGRRKPVWCLA